jgi:flagellar hook-basal body complex protein FliE
VLDKISMLGLRGVAPIIPPAPVGATEKSTGEAFESVLTDAINRVEQFQLGAQQSTDRFLRGEEEELHQVVLAGERADVAFEMFLGVRNKVVSAYQEIMRMQL